MKRLALLLALFALPLFADTTQTSNAARRIVRLNALPATCKFGDVAYLLTGTTGRYWCTAEPGTWTLDGSGGTTLAGNGTAAAPAFSFASDTNTGMYRVGADVLGFSTGGVLDWSISGKNLLSAGTTFAALGTPANGGAVYCSDCTSAAPTVGAGSGAWVFRENGAWNGHGGGGGSAPFPDDAPIIKNSVDPAKTFTITTTGVTTGNNPTLIVGGTETQPTYSVAGSGAVDAAVFQVRGGGGETGWGATSTGNFFATRGATTSTVVLGQSILMPGSNPVAWTAPATGSVTAATPPVQNAPATLLDQPVAGILRVDDFAVGGAGFINQTGNKVVATQFDVTSSTTLANVTGLSVAVVAGRTYSFVATLYTTSNVAGGVKAAIAGTATATAVIYEGADVQSGAITGQTRATSLGTTVAATTAVTTATIVITGTITVDAAGSLAVQFAQNVSSLTASSVLVGSTFVLTAF